jgi:hypothetical protein
MIAMYVPVAAALLERKNSLFTYIFYFANFIRFYPNFFCFVHSFLFVVRVFLVWFRLGSFSFVSQVLIILHILFSIFEGVSSSQFSCV